jgi:hypothetical protein
MRGRTWISVLDALGYLVWGFGWSVVPRSLGDTPDRQRLDRP